MKTSRLIDRAGLVTALNHAAQRRVTIISAPAGSGKTSLLRAWASLPGQTRRLVLVQVQRDQQDTSQFWLTVLGAIRHATGAEPPAATPDVNAEALAAQVLSEVAEVGGDVMLVIDDLHELRSTEAPAQLTRLLTNLPPRVRAVLTTRHDVQLRLHRLRLAGELAEIRAADLRFTERETRDLLDASGIMLSEAGVALLHQRTEGWAAGLRLAALALAGHADPERFVTEFSGSDRTVAEYLIAEMLDRQPGDVRDLLLRTSVLDRVNGELADLLTGRPGSERILLSLEDANAFVESVDPEHTWFRYHHLFADILRLELRRTLPAEVAELHRRAAGWHLSRGRALDAIRHTQAAGDWPEAARMLVDHSFGLTLDGQAQTMRALLAAFPRAEVHPELALARATVDLAQGHLDEGAAYLRIAQAHAEAAPSSRRRRLRPAIAALNLSLAGRRGSFAGVVDQARILASPVAGRSEEDIALGSDLRAVALMNLGIAEGWSLERSDALNAERHLREGAALARDIGRPYLEVACLARLGFASLVLHSFATTQRHCRTAIACAERYGWGTEPVIAPALMMLAATMVWTGEFDEGELLLRRTERALQTDTGPDIRLLLHQTAGLLHAGRGRHREALAEFAAAGDLASRLADSHTLANRVTGWLLAAQARLGRLGEARASLASLDGERIGSGEIRNARAVISLADGDPAGALSVLSDVLDGTAPAIAYATVVEAYLLAGLAHRELGDARAASRAAERALELAEADRLILPFAMTGSAELLEELPRHETAHAALLDGIIDVLRAAPRVVEEQTSLPTGADLSPGELRVLRFLPTNLSRPEIAGELAVSVNTVGTHLRNIYAKLQVSNRSSAVHRARQLRLLAAGSTREPRVT